jgi:hypothetical protein
MIPLFVAVVTPPMLRPSLPDVVIRDPLLINVLFVLRTVSSFDTMTPELMVSGPAAHVIPEASQLVA